MKKHGRQGHDTQVSNNRDRGDCRKDGQGESKDESEGWSGRSEGGLAKETEEDRMTKVGPGGIGDMLTVSPWVTQESGAGGIQGGARAGGSDASKAPSAAANEAGKRGHHGARPGQGEKDGGQREKWEAYPWECGETKGGVRPPERTTSPTK